MTSPYQIANRHVEAALAEASRHSIPADTLATNLIAEAVRLLKTSRSVDDIRSELAFAMDNIEEQDFTFMRP
ncbi:hypothetical protein [Ferrovibrio sp.]|uniref:hypothetical protein n=1 Tax=Ferrovibrio sp. TaxID=1917215 RepID=UPI0025BA9133|nr:hypothetical protein [Ferrovibrio sp.]MBX3455010.1 hypothetical protein [Ferrovibrio sp.]